MTAAGQDRLTAAQALTMLTSADTADLIARADAVRRARHGTATYFVHSLNLNPTNICANQCELCAFWREPDADDAYVLDIDHARDVLRSAKGLNLTEVHIVGGVLADLDLAYYEGLIGACREILPDALVQGMTAVEVHYLAELEGLSVTDVLQRLRAAGLGALPGGGAEIFSPESRRRICPNKMTAEQWLSVHEQAHGIGMRTNATMLFGHVETPEQVVDHMLRLRDLQDRTGGFEAFVPLPFHPRGTRLPQARGPGGHTIVRTVAVARLILDNVPHIRVLANYFDRHVLAVLARAGVDDVGGTSLDERIARAAGASDARRFSTPDEMAEWLAKMDLELRLVNSLYEPAARPGDETQLTRRQSPAAAGPEATRCLELADNGERLTTAQAITLHDQAPFHHLGRCAHRRRLQVVPGKLGTFVIDRNISFTNVCEAACRFCAFHVAPGADGAFTLTKDDILAKVADAAARGATQILLQGGLNPQLDLPFFEDLFAAIKSAHDVCLHSLSPTEIQYLAQRANISVAETLRRLCDAGLDSLPGGGAEILVDSVRRRVSPRKVSADGWFDVMRTAHEMGVRTTATMVYGLGESAADRVEHLIRVRDLQDATGGFTAFIPWSFQSHGTQLPLPPATAIDYLRIVPLARLVLDNVPHLQAGWVTEGPDAAQLAMSFGADDFGGILMEERVIAATGTVRDISVEDVVTLIRETGLTPAQRTTRYDILRTFD